MLYRVALAAALVGTAAAGPARAQATAEQAAAMTAGLRGWIAGLLTPLIAAEGVPLAVTPDGERYRLEFAPSGAGIPGLTVTASGPATLLLRPLDGTRWAIEDYRLPAEFAASLELGDKPSRFAMRIAEQKIRGEIDPGLTMPTRLEGQLAGITQTIEGQRGPQTTTMGKLSFNALWTPTGGSVMSGGSTSVMEGYSTRQTMPGGDTPISYTVAKVTTNVKAEGVDLARIQTLVRTASKLASDIRAEIAGGAPSASGPTPEQRAALHALLESVTDAFSRAEGRQELTGLHFAMGDMAGDLARAELGSIIGAPGGNAELRLRIAAEGLESPMIPPGGIRELVPRRVVISPRVSGVPKQTLVEFLAHAIDLIGDPDADLADEAMQLLADNPVTIGIDELLVELGAAKLGGTGQLQVASATDVTGAAELRMTGLDPLIRLLGQLPETRAAVPFAVMLKGIGKAEGSETVWRIAYSEGKATVNGTDLSTLVPGGGKRR